MIETKITTQEVEVFLYKEVRLINKNQLVEWLDLFATECQYWIPCNADDIDPETHVSIIYDDRNRLEERVGRLESGLAYGQQPRSKTRHLLTNVEILEDEGDETTVTANFIIAELRRGVQTMYVCRNEYKLCIEADQLKIRSKKVELLNNNEPIGNLSFIV